MHRSTLNLALAVVFLLAPVALARAQDEAKLLAVLKKPDATRKDKQDACRDLAQVATAKAVPVLAGLLGDAELSHMARYALEPIPDASVDVALRAALGKVKKGPLLGVIGSIGVRGDAKAVPALGKLLAGPNAEVAKAAARALGNIGTIEAAEALQSDLDSASPAQLKVVCEGLFRCAESLAAKGNSKQAVAIYDRVRSVNKAPHQVRTAALRGAVLARQADGLSLLMKAVRADDYPTFASAARISMELEGTQVTRALAGELGKLPAERQVLIAQTLGYRGDAAAAPALLKVLNKGETAARVAAMKALTRLADASALPVLAKLSLRSDNELAAAARESLAGFPSESADQTVAGLLKSDDVNARRLGAELVGLRRIESAVPALLKIAASDPDDGARVAALKVLRDLAGADQLATLLEILLKAESAAVIQATEQAIPAVCARGSSTSVYVGTLVGALDKASGPAKLALLRVLRSVGGAKALAAVRAAAADGDTEVKETARRVLCEWPTADALPAVMDLAKNPPSSVLKVLALRGCFRLISLQETSPAKKLEAVKRALALAERTDEKRLALSTLRDIPLAEALAEVTRHLNDPALKEEACVAAVEISKQIIGAQPDAVIGAMSRVVPIVANKETAKQAQQLLKRAEAAAFKKLGYQPAGPWQPLFNGKDIGGWEKTGNGVLKVENGNLVGTQTDGKGGNLWAPGEWSDFELRATYRVGWPANSGIWFRYDGKRGYQYDILKYKKPVAFSGTLYCPGKMFIIQNLDESLENRDGWNQARIRAAGPNITQWINGVVTGSVKDDLLTTGKIGLQVHGGDQFKGMKIIIKKMEVRPLKAR